MVYYGFINQRNKNMKDAYTTWEYTPADISYIKTIPKNCTTNGIITFFLILLRLSIIFTHYSTFLLYNTLRLPNVKTNNIYTRFLYEWQNNSNVYIIDSYNIIPLGLVWPILWSWDTWGCEIWGEICKVSRPQQWSCLVCLADWWGLPDLKVW